MTMTFDNSPPDGSPGALVGFVGGARRARASRGSASPSAARAVLGCFEALFGPRARAAERYIEQDWAAERWSGGGPVVQLRHRRLDAPSGPALREPGRPDPLGRDRDRDPLGAATSTARSARASAPRPRCSPRSRSSGSSSSPGAGSARASPRRRSP